MPQTLDLEVPQQADSEFGGLASKFFLTLGYLASIFTELFNWAFGGRKPF